jgi:signal transduction histidine kinase
VRRRLLASYLAVAVLVLALLEIPLAISFAENERRELTDRVERDAVALSTLVEDSLEHGTALPAQVRRVAADYDAETGGRVLVVDAEGRAVLDTAPTQSRDFSSRSEVGRALAGEIATGTRTSRTLGTDLLYVAVPVASSGVVHGAVRVTYPMSAVDARIHRYWSVLALIAIAVLGIAVVIAVALARWVVRPLDGLERAADAIGAGKLDARAPVEGPPEVRRLAETFNAMVERIDVLVHSQDEFVADASHQLRTPLAALRLRLENLERDLPTADKLELERALAEVERLSALVDALLTLARADRAAASPSPVDVSGVAHDRLAAFTAYADERGVRLDERIEPGAIALATPGRSEQILDNLLANALDHSPSGAAVTVSVRRRSGRIELSVADEGPGLDADARARAFDRFWRADGGGGGFGLGLPIAQRLARSDGGAVELRAREDAGGLEAVVILRAATASVEEAARRVR